MRVAVFTNKFPGHTTTFFARDMRALLEAGIDLDIFPFYPLDARLWSFVPPLLNDAVLPRHRVHHVSLLSALRRPDRLIRRQVVPTTREAIAIGTAALRYGPRLGGQVAYVAAKAWAWALMELGPFDHIFAYWGNHAATCAYLYHHLTDQSVPFSMLVHARMDLYRRPAALARKMLYADNVFLVCDFNRRYIAEHYPRAYDRLAPRLRVHHIGLDLAAHAFTPESRPAARVIAVGRLEPLKGFHNLIEAVRLTRVRGLPTELHIVGGGEQEAELRRLTERLGLQASVTFHGWLPPDAVIQAMRSATVLVHPPIELDAMPTVLKEAMAIGTPVIASALAGSPEIVDEGRAGLLVPPGDVKALADAICRVLGDPELRRRLAVAGRRRVEEVFDLWQNGARLAEVLRSTPRRRGPP